MPHQCTKCSKVFPDAAEELLKGCECGSGFFYYIRQEKFDELQKSVRQVMVELEKADKDQIEKDIRELTGMDKRPDEPVILDLESVRVIKPGKFEIDIVNLFNKNRPLIYKLGEGKYIIDLASSLSVDKNKVRKKIINPLEFVEEEDESEEDDEEVDREEDSNKEYVSLGSESDDSRNDEEDGEKEEEKRDFEELE